MESYDIFLKSSDKTSPETHKPFGNSSFQCPDEVLSETLSFNYNIEAAHQRWADDDIASFRWSNGIYEIPARNLRRNGALEMFNRNRMNFNDVEAIHRYMEAFYASYGDIGILVLQMHSWSFCVRDRTTGYYEYHDDRLVRAFHPVQGNRTSELCQIEHSGEFLL